METIKLNENKLKELISESITEVIKEMNEVPKTSIRLTEAQLTKLVAESTLKILRESNMEEGWFSDKFNQGKAATSTLFNKTTNAGLGQRFSNMKKNWNTQGELNNMNNLIAQLTQLLDNRKITPQTTVAQLVGGKYNNGKFGTMSGLQANRKSQIANRGGQSF